MPQDKPPGYQYSLNINTGTHPECWFLTLSQGPQTFALYATTEEEKKNFASKVNALHQQLGALLGKL